MNKKGNSNYWIWGIIMIISLLVVSKYSPNLFSSVNIQSPIVQYNNNPIIVTVSTNETNPQISVFFNNQILAENSNQSGGAFFTKQVNQGSYTFTYNTNQEGLLKIVINGQVVTIEVKQPYVDSKNNIAPLVEGKLISELVVQTFTPQGAPLDADAVDITVTKPDNTQQTLNLEKTGNTFKTNFNYDELGNYVFKIYARKSGYVTVERSAITSIIQQAGIHPVLYIWVGALLILIFLLIIKTIRKRL